MLWIVQPTPRDQYLCSIAQGALSHLAQLFCLKQVSDVERERKLGDIQSEEKKGITRDSTYSPRDLQVAYLLLHAHLLLHFSSSFQEGCPLHCYAIYNTKVSLCYEWTLLCYHYDTRPLRPSRTT
jgi:hypothetical protein